MATKKSNKSLWVMLALIAAIIAVILLLPSCGNRNAKKGAETDAESTTLVKSGDTAPDFTVEMVDGSSVTLGDLKGKVDLCCADPFLPHREQDQFFRFARDLCDFSFRNIHRLLRASLQEVVSTSLYVQSIV